MKLLTSPKSTYLLNAGLDVLHEQSNEWLNEIAFWRDEVAFFYSLIVTKTMGSVPLAAKSDLTRVEKDLVAITSGELDKLQEKTEAHERFLIYLLENKSSNEEEYRNRHRELANEFSRFEKRIRSVKKEVFDTVKLIDKKQTA